MVEVYHGGPIGQKFDFDKLVFSTKGDSAQLGYFFSPTKEGARYYAGKNGEVRRFNLDPSHIYTMHFSEYRSYGSRKDFRKARERLLAEGYSVVAIPHMDEYVALSPAAIKEDFVPTKSSKGNITPAPVHRGYLIKKTSDGMFSIQKGGFHIGYAKSVEQAVAEIDNLLGPAGRGGLFDCASCGKDMGPSGIVSKYCLACAKKGHAKVMGKPSRRKPKTCAIKARTVKATVERGACPACGSEEVSMAGGLGNLMWYRCRCCGLDYHT